MHACVHTHRRALNALLEPIRRRFDNDEMRALIQQAYPPVASEASPTPAPAPAPANGAEAEAEADGAPAADAADVSRVDIRVGRVLSAEKHPDADELYVETIDVGDSKPRTVISGLARHLPLEALRGRLVLCVCNLKPQKMRGIASEAMLLVASDAGARQTALGRRGPDRPAAAANAILTPARRRRAHALRAGCAAGPVRARRARDLWRLQSRLGATGRGAESEEAAVRAGGRALYHHRRPRCRLQGRAVYDDPRTVHGCIAGRREDLLVGASCGRAVAWRSRAPYTGRAQEPLSLPSGSLPMLPAGRSAGTAGTSLAALLMAVVAAPTAPAGPSASPASRIGAGAGAASRAPSWSCACCSMVRRLPMVLRWAAWCACISA